MRRRRSDELPRFAGEDKSLSFRFRRRHILYAVGFILVCWFLYPSRKTTVTNTDVFKINWHNYAYSLHATNPAELCHTVLLFDALARFGSKADRILFYPQHWDTKVDDSKDRDSQLLVLARDKYGAKLHPVKPFEVAGRTEDGLVWDQSVTKMMAFSLEYYDRIIALDSDITLLDSLDELFLLPRTPMAMPRAYWTDSKPWPLSTMLMVIQPNLAQFEVLKKRIQDGGDPWLVRAHRFDMALLNELFEESALVLPHRPYALRTAEFSRQDHSDYLGGANEEWDAGEVFKEAKLVQFSDRPLPPPWFSWPHEGVELMQPDCGAERGGECEERRIWRGLVDDFRDRRKDICKLLNAPGPSWDDIKPKDGHKKGGKESKTTVPSQPEQTMSPSPVAKTSKD